MEFANFFHFFCGSFVRNLRNSAEWNVLNEAENTTLLLVVENIIKLAKVSDKQICKDHLKEMYIA